MSYQLRRFHTVLKTVLRQRTRLCDGDPWGPAPMKSARSQFPFVFPGMVPFSANEASGWEALSWELGGWGWSPAHRGLGHILSNPPLKMFHHLLEPRPINNQDDCETS